MGQIRGEVLGLDHLGRCAQGLHGVAIVAGDGQFGLAHAGLEAVHDSRAGELRVLARFPIDGHFAQRLFGTPPIVSHHGDKFAQVQHLDDAQGCSALAGWHAPLGRSCANQHFTRGGTGFAQILL